MLKFLLLLRSGFAIVFADCPKLRKLCSSSKFVRILHFGCISEFYARIFFLIPTFVVNLSQGRPFLVTISSSQLIQPAHSAIQVKATLGLSKLRHKWSSVLENCPQKCFVRKWNVRVLKTFNPVQTVDIRVPKWAQKCLNWRQFSKWRFLFWARLAVLTGAALEAKIRDHFGKDNSSLWRVKWRNNCSKEEKVGVFSRDRKGKRQIIRSWLDFALVCCLQRN